MFIGCIEPENFQTVDLYVVPDTHAPYFGTEINDKSLVPGENAQIYPTTFDNWLGRRKMAAQSGMGIY